MNEIVKLDGMVKIKGKCGYEIVGGCGELRKAKAKLEKIKEKCKEAIRLCDCFDADVDYNCINCTDGGRASLAKEIMEVLKNE